MIALCRLRLINWHNFVNDLLNIQQITYLIGVNGVGKTTILDALRYCLTTSKSFNALGNRKSKRTLLGSVHGKQRDQDGDRPRYSRKGHTVSYVGAEFRDDTAAPGKDTFVITVRVESEKPDEDMRHVQQRWYISPRGVMLEDLPFLGPDYIPTKREQFCPKNGKMRDTDNQKLAKDLICRALGIGAADSPLGKKFCAVFPMGTGMDDIEDFREFIYHYILPQPEIDPQALQQEQIELDHLNDVLLQAKERAQLLTEIGTLGETARSKQRDCRVNQGFVLYASQQAAEGAEEQILSAICDGNREIDRLQEELQYQKERTEQAHQRWMDALRENQNSPERQQLQVFEDLVKDREKDYTEARKALSSLQNAKQELEALNRKLSDCRRALPAEQMPDAIEQLPEQRQTEQLTAMEQLLREREDSLDQEEFQVRSDLQQLKERQKALQAKIETLEKGLFRAAERSPEAERDLSDFTGQMIDRYAGLPAQYAREVAPRHLNLGMRFAHVNHPGMLRAARHFDVFSLNCYAADPTEALLAVQKALDMPVLIGEFHFGALDAGLPAPSLFHVKDQKARGDAYARYLTRAAAQPCSVGAHYFAYNDQPLWGRYDGENYQFGFVDVCNRPYEPFGESVRRANEEIYRVKEGLAAPEGGETQRES